MDSPTTSIPAKAIALAIGAALISGVSNFVNKAATAAFGSPVLFTTLKNACVALALFGLIVLIRNRAEMARLNRRQAGLLLLVGAIGGALPFALFFTGLAGTSAAAGALIHKTLFVWVLLLAVPLLGERPTAGQIAGAFTLLAASLLAGKISLFNFGLPEALILAATLLWAVENVIAKKALAEVSAGTVAAARMVIGSAILLPFAFWQSRLTALPSLSGAQWLWLGVTAALLFGYVLSWYGALKLAPAGFVAMLLVPAALITNALTAVFVTHTLAAGQLASGLLLIAGTAAIIYYRRRAKPVKRLITNS